MAGHLIPCPVCGADLIPDGHARAFTVDCAGGHRSRTDPELYESLRLQSVIDALARLVGEKNDEPVCAVSHRWVTVKGMPELPVSICSRCLTLAVVET